MKISPGVKGHEKYAIFYACALHVHSDSNKRKLKSTEEFKKRTKILLEEFLSTKNYIIEEIETFFNV